MWATRKAMWWELTELTRLIFCRPVAVCFDVRLFIVLFFFFCFLFSLSFKGLRIASYSATILLDGGSGALGLPG